MQSDSLREFQRWLFHMLKLCLYHLGWRQWCSYLTNSPYLYLIGMGPVCSKTDGEEIYKLFCSQNSSLALRKNRYYFNFLKSSESRCTTNNTKLSLNRIQSKCIDMFAKGKTWSCCVKTSHGNLYVTYTVNLRMHYQ